MSFIGSGPQKTEGVGKLCCNSIWFLCGSLCSLKGKEDVFALSSKQAPLPGSDLPNYHPYKEAKRPLTRAGLSPPLVLQPAFLQCQSCNCIFLPLHARAFCFLLSSPPLSHHPSPVFQLTPSPTHLQRGSLPCFLLPVRVVLTWKGNQEGRQLFLQWGLKAAATFSDLCGIRNCQKNGNYKNYS